GQDVVHRLAALAGQGAFELLHVLVANAVQLRGTQARLEVVTDDRLFALDATWLQSIRPRVAVDVPGHKFVERWHLLLRFGGSLKDQGSLTPLPPSQCTRLGRHGRPTTLPKLPSVWPKHHDVHFPTPTSVGSYLHAHRRNSFGDGARLSSSHRT